MRYLFVGMMTWNVMQWIMRWSILLAHVTAQNNNDKKKTHSPMVTTVFGGSRQLKYFYHIPSGSRLAWTRQGMMTMEIFVACCHVALGCQTAKTSKKYRIFGDTGSRAHLVASLWLHEFSEAKCRKMGNAGERGLAVLGFGGTDWPRSTPRELRELLQRSRGVRNDGCAV